MQLNLKFAQLVALGALMGVLYSVVLSTVVPTSYFSLPEQSSVQAMGGNWTADA